MIGLGLNTAADTSHPALFGGLPAETQNYSAYLDGASDRIQGAGLATTWFKVMGANVEWSIHFSIKLDALNSTISFTGTATDYVWLVVDASGDLQLTYAISSPASTGLEKWDTNFATGTWYDVVITASNDTSRDLKCYVNTGERSAVSSTAWAASVDNTAIAGKFTMGTFLNVVDYDFRIDRLASWTKVLTSAEITEIYTNYPDLTADSGNYTSSNRLETYYKIEEGSGTTMSDSSGNSNGDLTVVNATSNFWSTDTRI